jgi:predicted helicase
MSHSLDALLQDIADRAVNTTELGVAVEHAVAWALTQSPQYGARIVRIDRWEDFAREQGLAVTTDIGIDLVVTDTAGGHWAIQVKGHDAEKTHTVGTLRTIVPERKRVELDVWAKLVAASLLHPFSERFIITTGAGVTSTVEQMNAATNSGVISLGRAWLRSTGEFPDYTTVENWWENRNRRA